MKGIALSVAAFCLGAISLNSHAVNCDNIPQWDSGAVYTNGMQAQHAQKAYKANWWTQNHNPANFSGPWQEWTYLGDCDVLENRPPVAVLSITRSSSSSSDFWVTGYLTLNGSSSYDPDNQPISYSWDGVNFSTQSTKTVPISRVFDNCFDIYHTYTLTVKDSEGAIGTASQRVLVAPADTSNPGCRSSSSRSSTSSSVSSIVENRAPVARIARTSVELVAGSVPLNVTGNQSTDPDGDALTYSWNFGDGSTATGMNANHLYATAGSYTVSLTVNDGRSGFNTASISVIVSPPRSSSSVGSSSSIGQDLCDTAPNYSAGSAIATGNYIKNEGKLYRCTVGGWCSSSAAWAFAPGTGVHWGQAWEFVKDCAVSSSSVSVISSSRSSVSSAVSSSTSSVSSAGGLPKHALVGYWHNFNNGSGLIRLVDVDDVWDVIVIAFADDVGNGTVAFNLDPALNKAQFIADVATKRAQGKKVVLSFGGERGTVTLNNATNLANFVNSTAAIINEYGFDGIDIDLESGANVSWGAPVIGNIVAAVRQLKQQFPDMYLSMAPEHPYVHGGMIAATGIWGAYLPMIDGLRDDLDLLHVQLYNNGSLATPYASQPLQAGTVDFMVASVKMLVEGFTIANNTQFVGLRPDQVAIGVPSGSRSAGSGFVTVANLNSAVNCLVKLVGCGSIKPNQAYPDFRGVMTWSINWDVADGRPFSIPVNANLDSLP